MAGAAKEEQSLKDGKTEVRGDGDVKYERWKAEEEKMHFKMD